MLVRALEWRARRFTDPADRLQFLRKTVGGRTGVRGRGGSSWNRRVQRGAVIAAAVGLALAPAAWLGISSRHTIVADAKTSSALPPTLSAKPGTLGHRSDAAAPVGPVWLVQSTAQFDLYSNGLRIETQHATSTAARRYLAFARDRANPFDAAGEWRTEPAGIVFHTTESHIAPFEEDQNQSLRRAGEGLLEYVSRRQSYHFLIDRFGRVFRVVRESDYANHAGNSVWADRRWVYVNLNESFFGVAFEATSKVGANAGGSEAPVNPAQIHAGRILTEMLRARYRIDPANCVAHAQVSISPVNRAVGYHRDWAANLPFFDLGLADNYRLPPASVSVFGFEADDELAKAGVLSMAEGLNAAEAEIERAAAAQKISAESYRAMLQKRYRDAIRALRGNGAS